MRWSRDCTEQSQSGHCCTRLAVRANELQWIETVECTLTFEGVLRSGAVPKPCARPKMVKRRVSGGGVQDNRSMETRIRNAHLLSHMYWTRVWNSWLCCTYQVHRVDPQTAPLQGLHREDLHPQHVEDHRLSHHTAVITVKSSYIWIPSKYSGPIWNHRKSPIDTTRALIGRTLVLMTLNPFERVAVSLKLDSMLLHYSSPPASLVFAVFSCEQILKRPLRMEFELQEKFDSC